MLTSVDIHPNPGPNSSEAEISTTSFLSDEIPNTSSYSEILKCGVGIMHLNIQNLRPKLTILEAKIQQYDVVVLTETWLNQSIQNTELILTNFQPPFRRDREDRIGGGVAIYVHEGIHAKERTELNVNGTECLWIELVFGECNILFGGIYRPPNPNNDQWLLMGQSIDQAFFQIFDNIIVTRDFNMNLLGANSNKITNLFSLYNAEQLITSPTFYTESSNSLLDLMFIKNKDSVISSFVADPFIPNLTRFHCPVVLVLRQTKPKRLTFKRCMWLYENGDYDAYRRKLHETDWNSLTDLNDFDIATKNITNSILSAAEDTILNK